MPITTRRLRHETRFRRLRVASSARLTPRMQRVTVEGPDLAGFAAPGFDDHVRLFFPPPGERLPAPQRSAEGRLLWPDPAPRARDYTPRAFDPARLLLTIDVVLHEGGVASDWAERARPGDELGLGGPRGSLLVEGEADWHLLMGDATALPAIARRLEELPPGARALAAIEVADAAEEQRLDTRADLSVTWLHAARGESLAAHLAALTLPPGEGFVFLAAEAGTVAQGRERLAALGHPGTHLKAANYWRRGVADDQGH